MSKKRKIFVGFGIFVAIIAAFYVESTIYPLSSLDPNYSDVERVFSHMQFPADWKEIRSSENRGIAGRQCPVFPESRCFHRSKTFTIPASANEKDVEKVLLLTGCPSVSLRDNTALGEIQKSYNLECSIDGLDISASFRGPEQEAYVSVGT